MGSAEGDMVGRAEGDMVGRAEGDRVGRAAGDKLGRAKGCACSPHAHEASPHADCQACTPALMILESTECCVVHLLEHNKNAPLDSLLCGFEVCIIV